MAINFTNMTTAVETLVLPVIVDQILGSNIILHRLLRQADEIEGGLSFDIPIMYAKNTRGGSYDGAEVFDMNDVECLNRATFLWKQYYKPIVITGKDLAMNRGPAAIFDLLKAKCSIAEKSMKDDLGTDLYSDGTGNFGKVITGFKAAVDDSKMKVCAVVKPNYMLETLSIPGYWN